MDRPMATGAMAGMLALALGAQAAKPEYCTSNIGGIADPVPNAINGTVFFPLDGDAGDYVFQVEQNGEWVTVAEFDRADYKNNMPGDDTYSGVNYLYTKSNAFRGISRWRVAFADPAPETEGDWLYATVDARNPLAGAPLGTYGYGGNPVSGPMQAFDGDLATMYHSADEHSWYAWVGLDLGEPKYIGQMAVFPRQQSMYGLWNRFGNGVFEVANDPGFTDAKVFHVAAYQNSLFYVFAADTLAYGRYVRYYANGTVGYINALEIEFSEVEPPANDNPALTYFRENPFAINGTAYFPIVNAMQDEYVLQRYDGERSAWVQLAKTDYAEQQSSDNEYFLVATNFFATGVTRWRYGRVTIVNAEPLSWNEFTLDARNPVPLDDLTPIACAWDVFDPGNGRYGQTPDYSFDGDFWTTFHPNDAQTYQYEQFIGADLGRPRKIYGVVAAPHGSYRINNQRMRWCRVRVSDTGEFGDEAETVYQMGDAEAVSERMYFLEFDAPVEARYIRMEYGEQSGWFNVGEFEIDVLDESDVSAHLKAEVADFDTGYPKLTFAKRYGEGGKVAIYRSNLATGPWTKAGEVAAGTGEWTETDATMKYGREYFYKVGDDVVSYRRPRRLDREALAAKFIDWRGQYEDLQEDGNANNCITNWMNVFDGDTGTRVWLISNTDPYYLNPAIGLDFSASGRKAHLAFYRQCMGISPMHNGLVCACGANSAADVASSPVQLTQMPNFCQVNKTGQWHLFKGNPAEAYAYLYVMQPGVPALRADAWAGDMCELEFYGWYDTDLVAPGFTVIVR